MQASASSSAKGLRGGASLAVIPSRIGVSLVDIASAKAGTNPSTRGATIIGAENPNKPVMLTSGGFQTSL